jgi:hypothetical protein
MLKYEEELKTFQDKLAQYQYDYDYVDYFNKNVFVDIENVCKELHDDSYSDAFEIINNSINNHKIDILNSLIEKYCKYLANGCPYEDASDILIHDDCLDELTYHLECSIEDMKKSIENHIKYKSYYETEDEYL